jgi:hypothetical protein
MPAGIENEETRSKGESHEATPIISMVVWELTMVWTSACPVSGMHRYTGRSATAMLCCPWNVPFPVFNNTEIVDEFEFATAISGSPSPSMS